MRAVAARGSVAEILPREVEREVGDVPKTWRFRWSLRGQRVEEREYDGEEQGDQHDGDKLGFGTARHHGMTGACGGLNFQRSTFNFQLPTSPATRAFPRLH